jgi:hypothetical protein
MPAEPKRRKLLIIFSFIGIALLVVILANLPGDHGPMQNGKSLDEWLMVFYESRYRPEFNHTEPAQLAIKALGSNAVPHLVRRIAEGKERTLHVAWLVNGSPSLRKIEWLRKWANDDPRQALADGASDAFWDVGPAGDSAVAELTRLASLPNSTITARRALHALGGIGTTNCLPQLIAAMTNSNADIRASAADALKNLKDSARPAVPLLVASLRHPNTRLALSSANALGWLKLEPEIVVPALTAGLEDSRPIIREVTMSSLLQMGQFARPAIPALLNLTNAPDQRTRDAARDVIRQIAPEVLTNTSPN